MVIVRRWIALELMIKTINNCDVIHILDIKMLKGLGILSVCMLFIVGLIFLIIGTSSIDVILIIISLSLMTASYLLASEFNINLLNWSK
ncbi:MAG: hypothetical protein RIQ74_1443 [Pseudomonadota bacterium]|jgi:hypothetical protein